MRSPPIDLTPERLRQTLEEGWQLRAGALQHVPEGGGSHHWRVSGQDGRPLFVTVDDLDDKNWMGGTREDVFDGLNRALITAMTLRHTGLEFVVAPIAARDGEVLRSLDDRYTVSVYPYLTGCSIPSAHTPMPGFGTWH